MKRNINPEQILKNLKNMIDEAEDVISQGSSLSEEQIFNLKERVTNGFNRLRDLSGGGAGNRAKDYYEEAEERLRDYYEDVEDRLRTGLDTTNQTLRSHPYRLATVTFGLGIILGAIMRNEKSD